MVWPRIHPRTQHARAAPLRHAVLLRRRALKGLFHFPPLVTGTHPPTEPGIVGRDPQGDDPPVLRRRGLLPMEELAPLPRPPGRAQAAQERFGVQGAREGPGVVLCRRDGDPRRHVLAEGGAPISSSGLITKGWVYIGSIWCDRKGYQGAACDVGRKAPCKLMFYFP